MPLPATSPPITSTPRSLYRERFQPSATLEAPYAMAAINVLCAPSDEEAQFLASSQDQSFVRLRSGDPGRLPPPIAGYRDTLAAPQRATLDHFRQVSAIGSPATVRAGLEAFAHRTGADELIVAGATFDPALRRRSLALTMDALTPLRRTPKGDGSGMVRLSCHHHRLSVAFPSGWRFAIQVSFVTNQPKITKRRA
jgi:alkanesulfonate monooxygenase SsuD/methylene tetrahydromethanopterin reductase-like flavin-dependent oxidoreductase (luciferase family)